MPLRKSTDQIALLVYAPLKIKQLIIDAIVGFENCRVEFVSTQKAFNTAASKTAFNVIVVHKQQYLSNYKDLLSQLFSSNREAQLVLAINKEDASVVENAFEDGFQDFITLDKEFPLSIQFSRIIRLSKQRVKLEKKLKEGEDLFRLIAEHSSDLFCLHEPDGTIIYASPSSMQILGFSPAEMIGKKPLDFIESSYLKDVDKQTFISLLESRNSRIRYKFQHKNGSIRWLEATSNDIFDSTGNITRIQSFSRDITESVHLFDDLMKALSKEKELADLKSRFVSIASHEFRTPLSTILSSAELLQLKFEVMDGVKPNLIRSVDTIIEEVERMNNLINDILVLGKLEAGKTPFNPVSLDIAKLVSQTISTDFRNVGVGKPIVPEISGRIKMVEADPSLFRHIFVNLLSNAYKYSPGNQAPKVNIKYKKNELVLEVIDNGLGIPKEDQKNIFSSFFRAHNVLNIEGTGMGLVIVKEFVELHNGTVTLESEEGKGATFIVSLPYKQ